MTSDQSTNIKSIGVIGAGQMGSGISHVCALAGYQVRLTDIEAKALDNALQVIDRNLARQVARGRVSEADKNAAITRIKTGTSYETFADCDLVIETATEKEDIKREIFKKLVPHLKSSAIPRSVGEARQDSGRGGGLPRLHRQPHPAADDQRGRLYAL